MFKKLFGQILLHMGSMEEEFRLFHLRDDTAMFIITAACMLFANTIMLRVDFILFQNDINLFYLMIPARFLHILITTGFLFLAYHTKQVQRFDRLVFIWILFNAIYFSLFNFTRPSDYLTTSFDLLFIFGLYLLSPLPLKQTTALSIGQSIGSLFIAYSYKPDVPAFILNSTTGAHLFVQMLGLASALQIQSLKRRAFQAYAREKTAHEITQDLLHVDFLTHSLSRGHFFELAQKEFIRAKTFKLPMSVLIIDLDHFKRINDTCGHQAGDMVLAQFGQFILKHKRSQDIFGRLGGEEFSMVLPESTLKNALTLAKHIQITWVQIPVQVRSMNINSTMSVGIAQISESDETFDELLNRADGMMYKAKQRGRNRVACR